MQEFITQQQWMLLSPEVKAHLIYVFGITRTGYVEVRDNVVITDGFLQNDLKVITKQAMCDYIGSEETFLRAWELTLAKVKFELNPPVGTIETKKETVDIKEEVKETEHASTKKNK